MRVRGILPSQPEGDLLGLRMAGDAALRPLPDEVAVNLYRVVQEALGNVVPGSIPPRSSNSG